VELQELIDTVVDLGHLLVYAETHRSSSFRPESKVGLPILLEGMDDFLQLRTAVS
jgi:hypothetical protein